MRAVVMLLVIAVMFWGLFVYALVSSARRRSDAFRASGRTKGGTIVMLLLTGGFGGLYYLLRIRREVLGAERSLPASTPPPKDTGDLKEWLRTRDPWS